MAFTNVVASAPGKVILHGEHSVVYGKVSNALRALLPLNAESFSFFHLFLLSFFSQPHTSLCLLAGFCLGRMRTVGVGSQC